jgi:hypothetical protein
MIQFLVEGTFRRSISENISRNAEPTDRIRDRKSQFVKKFQRITNPFHFPERWGRSFLEEWGIYGSVNIDMAVMGERWRYEAIDARMEGDERMKYHNWALEKHCASIEKDYSIQRSSQTRSVNVLKSQQFTDAQKGKEKSIKHCI